MDLDPGTLTTILATLSTDLFTPTTILATTTKHQQTFHRLGNVLPHSKRLVPPNLEDKVFQLSIVTASVDFVTLNTPQAASVPECATRCASGPAKCNQLCETGKAICLACGVY